MAFHGAGQLGKPQGLTWPSTPWVAQPTALCAAEEGLDVTPKTPHCSAALSIPSGRLGAGLGDVLVKDQPARSVSTALLAPAAFLCWASEGVRGKT